jgi:hypothetical protein
MVVSPDFPRAPFGVAQIRLRLMDGILAAAARPPHPAVKVPASTADVIAIVICNRAVDTLHHINYYH